MDAEKITAKIKDLLPDKDSSINSEIRDNKNEILQEHVDDIIYRRTAKELAKIKLKEIAKLKYQKKKLEEHAELGIEPGRTLNQQKKIEEQEALVTTIESLEEQNKSYVPDLIKDNLGTKIKPEHAAILQSTSRPEITKLLTSLNINLSLQLTKNDTSNLLACLLTCNETQLEALYKNKKIPVAIKTVIRRILDDSKTGSMTTINSLWDRIFGKNGLSQEVQQQVQQDGVIPGTPISREAYIILRDTLLK